MKKFLLLISLFLFAMPSFADLNAVSIINPIRAERNASTHNSRGVAYFQEGDFYAALKEFKIAISISPNTQASSVYYNNLGRVYLIFGDIQKRNKLTTRNGGDFSEMARVCFERAITQDCMKIEYYKNLVESYKLLGVMPQKKAFFAANIDKNPFNQITIAVIMAEEGQKAQAAALLKDFARKNPDLIITDDVKKFAKSLEEG